MAGCGAWRLYPPEEGGRLKAVIIATGTEVPLAIGSARKKLSDSGIHARVGVHAPLDLRVRQAGRCLSKYCAAAGVLKGGG